MIEELLVTGADNTQDLQPTFIVGHGWTTVTTSTPFTVTTAIVNLGEDRAD